MDKTLLIEYINKNMSSYQIAKEINKSSSYVKSWLRKHKLKTKTRLEKRTIIINNIPHKQCIKCKEIKLLTYDNFLRIKGNKFHSYCRQCHSKYTIKQMIKYKNIFVEYKGGKCYICGYNKCYAALDFHHLDPNQKDFNIASSNMSLNDEMKKELDKCILICSNCHREIHIGFTEIPNL